MGSRDAHHLKPENNTRLKDCNTLQQVSMTVKSATLPSVPFNNPHTNLSASLQYTMQNISSNKAPIRTASSLCIGLQTNQMIFRLGVVRKSATDRKINLA